MTSETSRVARTDDASVLVLPANASVDVRATESLFRAARRRGWQWPTVCGGVQECGRCYVVVEEGNENENVMGPTERELIGRGLMAHRRHARLACALYPAGDMTVVRRGAVPGPYVSATPTEEDV
jgi:ferredoxin, 2Fe-2S